MWFADGPPSPELLAQLHGLPSAAGPWGAVSTPATAQAVALTPLIVASGPLHIPGMRVIVDAQGLVAKRYDARPGTTYLLRPDQHVLARWRALDTTKLQAAMARALGHDSASRTDPA